MCLNAAVDRSFFKAFYVWTRDEKEDKIGLMRKQMIRVGLLTVFLLLLFAGALNLWRENDSAQTIKPDDYIDRDVPPDISDGAGQADNTVQPTEKMENVNTEDADIAAVMSGILARGSGEFFCGYPVDEGFLCWLGGTYGQELLQKIESQLTEKTGADKWYEWTKNTMHVLWTCYSKDRGFNAHRQQNVVWKEAKDPSCIRLDFLGDVCLDEDWSTMQSPGGVEASLSDGMRAELESADLVTVSGEFNKAVKKGGQESGAYSFSTVDETVRLLEFFDADMVTFADAGGREHNGQELLRAMDAAEAAGIVCAGTKPAVSCFVAGGRKIAVVSISEPAPKSLVQETIAKADRTSDHVIVCTHWGTEGSNYFDDRQEETARTYVEAGADAVIGGHPHRLQGVQFLDGAPVVYSLGNVWYSTGALYTSVAQLRISDKGELTLYMLPCMQRDLTTRLLDGADDKKEFYHYLADVSSGVGIDEDGRVHPFRNVSGPGESPYAYTSGRRYGMQLDDLDLDKKTIDKDGNRK